MPWTIPNIDPSTFEWIITVRRPRMLRKLPLLVLFGAVVGGAAAWILTIPGSVSPGALPTRTANLDNGRTMFLAGGCPSCHAVPKQDDKTQLGGGLGLKSPFGIFYVPNISSDPW